MSSYAVDPSQQHHRYSHSDHGGSSDHGTFHETRSDPETHEIRSNPETEFSSASEHTWVSTKSQGHKDLIHKIKNMLDVTDEDHERVVKEIQNLQEAHASLKNIVNSLHREIKEVSDKNQVLQHENNHLQDMWHNLNKRVENFMHDYASMHEDLQENASHLANRHGTTHDHDSQRTLSFRDKLSNATSSLEHDDHYENEVSQEPDQKEIVVHDRQRKPDYHVHTITHPSAHFEDKKQHWENNDERSIDI